MASGTVVEDGGGNDGIREKKRFSESKVYTRKAYRGPKNNIHALTTTATTTATIDDTNENNRILTSPNATETTTNATFSAAEINNENGYKDDKNEKINDSDTTPVLESQASRLEDTNSAQQPSILPPVDNSDDSSGLSRQPEPAATANGVPEPASVANDVPKLTAPVNSVPEPTALANSVPEASAPTNSVPEPTAPVNSGPEPTAPANSVPEQTAPADSVPEPTAPADSVPEPTAPVNCVLEPRDVTNSLPEPTAPANSAPEPTAAANSLSESAACNIVAEQRVENKVKINLASKSKAEKSELRRKLESELDIVRNVMKKIEAKEVPVATVGIRNNSQITLNYRFDNGLKRNNSEMGSGAIPRESTTPTPRQSRPLNQLSISVLENSQGPGEFVEREKRTPKANQFYRNSEFLLAKDKFPPAESNKKSKLNWKRQGGGDSGFGFSTGTKMFKNCNALLDKLMKHQYGWVFNSPVDIKGLGLLDYLTIIKHPMDLGTIKSKLNRNWYKSPEEFAEDVRLTFHNAMTYNPKGQDVHLMAEVLLQIFEDRWAVIKAEYDREARFSSGFDLGVLTPTSRKASLLPPQLDMRNILDRSELGYDQRPKPMSTTPSSRTPVPKKPKAKDPNKRDMTYDEKQRLSTNLQSLPPEKLDSIVQIIKKRNSTLSQHGDEIEVDIDSVDAETLWELDRFHTNYKKSLSKNKRRAELAKARAEAAQQKVPAGASQENLTAYERNTTTSSPARVGNQGDNGTRSSSSSSSSSDSGSSSSDSDSDSSSASGSDVGH